MKTIKIPQGMKINLPSDPCPGGAPVMGEHISVREPPRVEHDFTMTLGCMPHDYEHLAGLCCWNCSEQAFFEEPACPNGWKDWTTP